MRHSVAIPIRSFDRNGPAFKLLSERCNIIFINSTGERLNGNNLKKALENADGVIAGTERYTEEILHSVRSLKVLSRVGVGIDTIDIRAAEKYGIKVLNTPEAPVQSVAEHTLALILAALKRLTVYNEQIRRKEFSILPGTMLSDKTVGIIGLGKIGGRVAAMLDALGCSIIYFDPLRATAPQMQFRAVASLKELVESADIITLHTPAQEKPVLTGEVFGCCKKGVIVINTARGSLIDEAALIAALESGTVSAAGLDVFPYEPYTGELLAFDSVIATPHVASNTIESRRQMEMEAVDNMLQALEGLQG